MKKDREISFAGYIHRLIDWSSSLIAFIKVMTIDIELTHSSGPTLRKANDPEVQEVLTYCIVWIVGIFCIAMANSVVHPRLDGIYR